MERISATRLIRLRNSETGLRSEVRLGESTVVLRVSRVADAIHNQRRRKAINGTNTRPAKI